MHNELSGGVESRHARQDGMWPQSISCEGSAKVESTESSPREHVSASRSRDLPAQSVVRLICEGGPQDGFTAERESCESLTFGQHADPRLAVYYRYRRTTDLDAATGRVVFEYAGCERVSMEANGLRRILLALRCLRPAQVEVGNLGAVGV